MLTGFAYSLLSSLSHAHKVCAYAGILTCDMIDEGEVLRYIPSEELVADLLTKAVTGAKFKYLRAILLGWNDEDMDKEA